jgi:type IV pilus assembly protein PilY1
MWKFDLTGSASDWKIAFSDGTDPQPLFQAKDGFNPQPITAKPDVMKHCSDTGLMVVFGTGRYLGNYDFTDQSLQTVYGIWDTSYNEDSGEYLGAFERGSVPELSNQPDSVTLLPQTEIQGSFFADTGHQLRVLSNNVPNWELTDSDPNGIGTHGDPLEHAGWYFDLPMVGERVPSNVIIRGGKAIVISFRPEQTPCGTGGESVVMEMNACSGGRLEQAQFDINGDGIVDSNDMIVITDDQGNPISVAPTGMYYPGRLMTPAILRSPNDNHEIKYFSTSVGGIVTMRERSAPIGITYWMEINQ